MRVHASVYIHARVSSLYMYGPLYIVRGKYTGALMHVWVWVFVCVSSASTHDVVGQLMLKVFTNQLTLFNTSQLQIGMVTNRFIVTSSPLSVFRLA